MVVCFQTDAASKWNSWDSILGMGIQVHNILSIQVVYVVRTLLISYNEKYFFLK